MAQIEEQFNPNIHDPKLQVKTKKKEDAEGADGDDDKGEKKVFSN